MGLKYSPSCSGDGLVEMQLDCFTGRVVGEECRRKGTEADVKKAPRYDSISIHFIYQRKVPVPAHSIAIESLYKHCA